MSVLVPFSWIFMISLRYGTISCKACTLAHTTHRKCPKNIENPEISKIGREITVGKYNYLQYIKHRLAIAKSAGSIISRHFPIFHDFSRFPSNSAFQDSFRGKCWISMTKISGFSDFPIFHQLWPEQKYTFSGPISKNFGFLESCVSESPESGIPRSRGKITVPPGTHHWSDFGKNGIHGPIRASRTPGFVYAACTGIREY